MTRQRHVLSVDIGGTHVKFRLSDGRDPLFFDSSPSMTPQQMMRRIRLMTKDWSFDRVSLGFPGTMQAIGGYDGGRMLFLDFGTALGAVSILDSKVYPMELGHLPFSKRGQIQSYVGGDALTRLGSTRWSKNALQIISHLSRILDAHYVIVGGGNAAHLRSMPRHVRVTPPDLAFIGGFRAWKRSPGAEL